MNAARNFQPVKTPKGRHSIGGLLAVAAVLGQIVTRKAGATDTLELATGKAGYFLTRDVVSSAAMKTYMEQDELYPDKGGFGSPFVVGGSVQAEDLPEVWVEGPALLSGIDTDTPVGTVVTTNAGKLVPLTDAETQEPMGIIRQVIAAINDDTADAARVLVEVRRGQKVEAA